jgi:hypothetical protein
MFIVIDFVAETFDAVIVTGSLASTGLILTGKM